MWFGLIALHCCSAVRCSTLWESKTAVQPQLMSAKKTLILRSPHGASDEAEEVAIADRISRRMFTGFEEGSPPDRKTFRHSAGG